jgi:hypothetical protein
MDRVINQAYITSGALGLSLTVGAQTWTPINTSVFLSS